VPAVAVSPFPTAPSLRRARWGIVLLGAALLLGCARGDTRAHNPARSALRAAGEPVLMTVRGNPFAMEQARLNALISTELASGVTGMSTQFTTSPERAAAPDPRVVVALNPLGDPDPETFCAAPDGIATGPATGQVQIVAAFCRVSQVLGATRTEGAASGPTDQRFRRLLWRTASTLFPDDYEQTYGFGILPRWLDLGIGGSIGGN
jgi:hypothetical protein